MLREEALRLKKDNEKLTTKLIFKNEELEKAYIQLQTSVSVTAGTKDAPNTDTLRTQIMESINHHFEGLKSNCEGIQSRHGNTLRVPTGRSYNQ